jgi:hypothetical protein
LNVEDFDLKSKHTIDLDFSNTVLHAMDSQGYRPEHYGIGEIFPNYTLLAKVAKVDFETNSHYAYLDVELGIKDNSSGEEA